MTHLTDRAFAGLPTGTKVLGSDTSSLRQASHPDTPSLSGSEAMRGITELIEKIAHKAHTTTQN